MAADNADRAAEPARRLIGREPRRRRFATGGNVGKRGKLFPPSSSSPEPGRPGWAVMELSSMAAS